MISLLVAMDRNRVIGYQNDLPWHLPNDLKFFKQTTTGNTIIMGRKTFEAIGRPLPNRKNIVISKQQDQFPDGIEIVRDIDTILHWNEQEPDIELFVIGGGNIFKQFLSHADRMYITWVDEDFQGDTFFPYFTESEWQLTKREKGEKDNKNPYDFYFLQYDRLEG
ncbi:dihydrofolate reductase [Lentibacillus amyloliquefaciens]|uniref:Dihydrofolate reductase n=1 Tax=Lentibacillus amyloliquefaciens TaxID=1472767 RepID=A0A0U4FBQ0_9BACI|nr:dihydrofolate reductase [Lentibacillus amyloliquefaciens]ALX47917.1 dihydrofolate reductase [Lentibacillus amyloliquefaciens]